MKIGITRDRFLSLIKGKQKLKLEKGKFAELYGIVNNELTFLTVVKIGSDGSLKIIEKPIKLKWFKYEKYLLVTKNKKNK